MTPRRNDPWTSYAARRNIADLHPSQAAVLCLFDSAPDSAITLENIVEGVGGLAVLHQLPQFSDSRIRTAVKELIDDGKLYDTGHTAPSRRRNPARLIARCVCPKCRGEKVLRETGSFAGSVPVGYEYTCDACNGDGRAQ